MRRSVSVSHNTVSDSRGGHRTADKRWSNDPPVRHRSQSTEDEDATIAVLVKKLRAATAQLLNAIQVGMRLSSLPLVYGAGSV